MQHGTTKFYNVISFLGFLFSFSVKLTLPFDCFSQQGEVFTWIDFFTSQKSTSNVDNIPMALQQFSQNCPR